MEMWMWAVLWYVVGTVFVAAHLFSNDVQLYDKKDDLTVRDILIILMIGWPGTLLFVLWVSVKIYEFYERAIETIAVLSGKVLNVVVIKKDN